MRSQRGSATLLRGMLATTTLRSVTSTRLLVTVTISALSAACLPLAGAVPSTSPPVGGRSRIPWQGIVASSDTGAWEISGAVTLPSWPPCGQFSVAVVCTTGSSGMDTARKKPSSPATVAIHRATVTSRSARGGDAGAGVDGGVRVEVMAGP